MNKVEYSFILERIFALSHITFSVEAFYYNNKLLEDIKISDNKFYNIKTLNIQSTNFSDIINYIQKFPSLESIRCEGLSESKNN